MLYRRVQTRVPVYLGGDGTAETILPAGYEGVVVDLEHDHVVLEFAFPAPHLVGGLRFATTFVRKSDIDVIG